MKGSKIFWSLTAISCMTLLLLALPAGAQMNNNPYEMTDNLALTGIVKSIDPRAKTVTVDVKSLGCRGIRHFTTDNLSDLEELVHQKINFHIDSTTCKRDAIYKMFPDVEVTK